MLGKPTARKAWKQVAIAGLAALAIVVLILTLTESLFNSTPGPETLAEMDCTALVVEMLEGDDAKRGAAARLFLDKKCV